MTDSPLRDRKADRDGRGGIQGLLANAPAIGRSRIRRLNESRRQRLDECGQPPVLSVRMDAMTRFTFGTCWTSEIASSRCMPLLTHPIGPTLKGRINDDAILEHEFIAP
jgi:hypothetical protein